MSAPKLPDGLPPLPAGAVYVGMGTVGACDWFDGWCCVTTDSMGWVYGQYRGMELNAHYAKKKPLPAADSEAVALVRKLRDALDARHNQRAYAFLEHASLLKEAEAFLAREGRP